MWGLLFLSAALPMALAAEDAAVRQAIPPADKLKEADATIRDVFKDDFKKAAAADRIALAEKLLQQGQATKDDQAARYQLLCMAMDLASKAGGLALAQKAIDALQLEFQVDGLQLKSRLLAEAERAARTKEQWVEVANANLALVEEAVRADDFGLAASACTNAQRCARTGQDMALLASATKKSQELVNQKAAFDRLDSARKKLFENPEDPAANLTLGLFYCLARQEWPKGLPHLAKSGDEKWSKPARADLADPQDSAAQVTVGDLWWEAAAALAKPDQDVAKARAGVWYSKALPQLSGLSKLKIEKRMEQLSSVPPPPAASTAVATSGMSEETRKALPTDEEIKKIQGYGVAYKNGELTKSNEFYTLKGQIVNRLRANPQAWSDADLRARLDAEKKLEEIYDEASGRKSFSSYSDLMNNCWHLYAGAARTPEQLAARLKVATDLFKQFSPSSSSTSFDRTPLQEQKIRHALHAFIIKNAQTYGNSIAKANFCDWLKAQGVTTPVIDAYKADLK